MEQEERDPLVVSVSIPRPVEGRFTYRLSPELARRLQESPSGNGWVRVPFGRSTLCGFYSDPPHPFSPVQGFDDPKKLKDVLEVLPSEISLPHDVVSVCKWVQDYYRVPLGEVIGFAVPSDVLKEPKKKKSGDVSEREIPRLSSPTLTQEQTTAVDHLTDLFRQTMEKSAGKVALLHGVTGSGKTEVYLRLAEKALAQGKSVLVLVPEIALTPQLHDRFRGRLGVPVGLWHSAMAAGARQRQWLAARRGELKVIVGARSAIFSPLSDLGLIVVDEEHDSSYKQEDRVRYQARDLAVVRGQLDKALVVLGSATPSLETRERALEGKYAHIQLKERVGGGEMPAIEIIPLATEERVEGLRAPLAKKTVDVIRDTLVRGQKAMIFLNRRGFAAFLLCEDCGEVAGCPQCSVSLSMHLRGRVLRCHVCGFHQPIPDICKACASDKLSPMGAGTESLETELPQLIPEMKALRLDRDQVTSATRLHEILEEFRSGAANVLLGTQMLVKGHDFPDVSLVVVVLADGLFRWPDFRASERALQILLQVSGRAGRAREGGRVLVQAYDEDHEVLKALQGKMTEEEFLSKEREFRRILGYPPFGRIARLRFEAPERTEAQSKAQHLGNMISNVPEVDILGPSEALLERVKGQYRWDILVKSKTIGPLQRALTVARTEAIHRKWSLIVDVDPYS